MDDQKVKALINLLDDPSEEVFSSVEQALLKLPVEIVPLLEKAWEQSADDLLQTRLTNVIHCLQLNDVKTELIRWVKEGAKELVFGVFLVAKYQYPDLSFTIINEKLNALRRDIWLEMHDQLTSLEKVRIVNHVLFDLYGFSRNNSNFFAPANNFINDVLETKKGNPISLSVIYSILCQRLGLPVYGVNLPKNFILAFMEEAYVGDETNADKQTSVLFYINPINKGTVLGRKEIDFFLKQYHIEPNEYLFYPCSNIDIVVRLFNNLISAYDAMEQHEKKQEIKELLQILDAEKY
ncbi:MAG: transglutaminase-like domain-containing protein [Breznakibacter sp.]